jgi:hypothetical protein
MIVKLNSKILSGGLLVAALLGGGRTARAQWITQTIELNAGWNAVFLHVDTSHDTLNGLVAGDVTNPILEIWRWNPPSVAQFTEDPAQPTEAPEWTRWVRTNTASALQRLTGDTAYLVRVNTDVPTYSWSLKGRPVAPRHSWTISGLNLIGFPTVVTDPPRFNAFLAQAPELQSATPEIYYYPGGDLGSNNPALLPSLLFGFTPVKRGQAFWMRSGTVFNRYFGPFEVVNSGGGGIDFGAGQSSSTFRLRNLSTSNLTVTLRLAASETPPPGQSNIVGLPPLLIRGTLNLTNLTYDYTKLPAGIPRTWTLAPRDLPGSEVEVVLGLDRSSMASAPGSLLAGVLSFTDSLGHTAVQWPVSATAASHAGLWVGQALVNQVAHYLKSYARDADNTPVASSNGNYIVTGVDSSLGPVSKDYPLRLIVHNPEAGNAVLLQRVYYGFDPGTNVVVANGESVLHPAYLKSARRITATHLPWSSTNTVWPMSGALGQATNLITLVSVAYDDQASNPFLHTYHPDHDNLNATFNAVLAQGSESYRIERAITLLVQPPATDFSSLVAAADTLTGEYREVVTLKGLARGGGANDTRQFETRGAFRLTRVSDVPTLTLAP